jgi:hypothetical protein
VTIVVGKWSNKVKRIKSMRIVMCQKDTHLYDTLDRDNGLGGHIKQLGYNGGVRGKKIVTISHRLKKVRG